MDAIKVSARATEFATPDAALWQGAPAEVVELAGVPLGLQPSPYIVASRQGRPVGQVTRLEARAVHNGSEIAFRLAWDDPVRNLEATDHDVFPDGAALLFPLHDEAPLVSMGAEGQPVTAWHWRADRPSVARSNVATGLGTTRVTEEGAIGVAAGWSEGRWELVFHRALRVPGSAEETVQFSAGGRAKLAFAIWEGSNGERAGLKAFSPQWHEVALTR